ncbi:efflux RND transporter periplasmic adaptor subunit [Herminiimonas fonticola]|uniref:Macrolide-specific efflux system membrane fusion protein n=1 Tax=Herminiimonas fonticola TaxID=303380 RepID=A0A4R6G7S9_9BURK|nr:efflux RND transporter periplasmic adaptor subunit [Herminiimonas fonticola]RBA23842.1 efflux transporter, RND family, MFP subunit [Herminiimonas fonticola]TDN89844.1 macrolide-specific efflux system membrane fusion protein [Herminiimonas fonticola]
MKSSSFLSTLRQRALHRYTVLALLVVLLTAAGYWGWHKFYAKKDPREIYQVAEVQRGDIQDLVTATGTVQPLEYVDVGAQVSGQLKKLHIEVGSVVKEGDLLAEIDPTVFRATVDARRAGLRNQQATMKERESALVLANLQYTRQKNLMAADATTAEALQTAEASLRAAKAQIDALQAQIEQTQSTLRADEANLNYAKIYAPMAGTVVSLTARQGQTLNANQNAPTILRIADLSTMTVQTQVSEAEVGKLSKGMEVYFTTLGSQGRRWYGALRKIEPTPTVTNNVVLYNALFDVPNKNQALMPNMTTQVFFIAATAKDVLLVPTAAVTIARGSGGAGGKRERGETAGKSTNEKSADASTTKNAASKAEAKDKPADTQATAQTAGKSADPSGDQSFTNMTQEERRASFEKMSPEEREAMRERRRAMREAAGKSGDSALAQSDKSTGDEKSKAGSTKSAAADKVDPLAATSNIGSPPTSSVSTSGFAEQSTTRTPRSGTVKVIDQDGKIEQRKVELGVTNRVQMQVVSGLVEGDTVIIGMKLPPSSKRTQAATGQQGGMPPGMGGAGAGSARGR